MEPVAANPNGAGRSRPRALVKGAENGELDVRRRVVTTEGPNLQAFPHDDDPLAKKRVACAVFDAGPPPPNR